MLADNCIPGAKDDLAHRFRRGLAGRVKPQANPWRCGQRRVEAVDREPARPVRDPACPLVSLGIALRHNFLAGSENHEPARAAADLLEPTEDIGAEYVVLNHGSEPRIAVLARGERGEPVAEVKQPACLVGLGRVAGMNPPACRPPVELAAADMHGRIELPGQQVSNGGFASGLDTGYQPDAAMIAHRTESTTAPDIVAGRHTPR